VFEASSGAKKRTSLRGVRIFHLKAKNLKQSPRRISSLEIRQYLLRKQKERADPLVETFGFNYATLAPNENTGRNLLAVRPEQNMTSEKEIEGKNGRKDSLKVYRARIKGLVIRREGKEIRVEVCESAVRRGG